MRYDPRINIADRRKISAQDAHALQVLLGFPKAGQDGIAGPRTVARFREIAEPLGLGPVLTPQAWATLRRAYLDGWPVARVPEPGGVEDPGGRPEAPGGVVEPGAWSWPLPRSTDLARRVRTSGGRAFGASRARGRAHCAVDLYASEGEPVAAVEAGYLVSVWPFYRGTWAAAVWSPGSDRTVIYGEIAPWSWRAFGLREPGNTPARVYVRQGEILAVVGKMRQDSMLHLEAYRGRQERNRRWYPGRGDGPAPLQDPTRALIAARGVQAEPEGAS